MRLRNVPKTYIRLYFKRTPAFKSMKMIGAFCKGECEPEVLK